MVVQAPTDWYGKKETILSMQELEEIVLDGGDGNDVLAGGVGNDLMVGGSGTISC